MLFRSKVEELKNQITNGELEVPTALGEKAMSEDEIQALIDSVKVK